MEEINPTFQDDNSSIIQKTQISSQIKIEDSNYGNAVIPLQDEIYNDLHSEDEDDDEDYSLLSYFRSQGTKDNGELAHLKTKINTWFSKAVKISLLLLFISYFIAVIVINSKLQEYAFWCSGDGLLYVLTGFTVLGVFYSNVVRDIYGKRLQKAIIEPLAEVLSSLWSKMWFRLLFAICAVAGVSTFLIIDTADERVRLQSLSGFFFLIATGFLFSYAPRKVVWRHLFWGFSIQFIFALLVLRWPTGKNIFQCLADKVVEFLSFTDAGSTFVYGPLSSCLGIFAFKVLPVILFFSFVTSILFYYGIIQTVVLKVGWLLNVTVGTTMSESVNAAANVFLAMTEAPLLIRPYLHLMTKSEIHAVMTGGFATIAGSVMAAYISFGIDSTQILTACLMNAPAALAMSKLMYPETKKSKINAETIKGMKSEEINALHAACVGVTNAIPLVANVGANLIAFISFVELINNFLDWGCQLVDVEEGVCSLESGFGYIFMPLSWLLGVQWEECYKVGELIGIKITINEFVAYSKLAEYIEEGVLSARSETIATFALCGFSNISSIGIMMGGMAPMAPERKGDMATIVVRAMITGSMATFMSACIAGMIISSDDIELSTFSVAMIPRPMLAFNDSYCPA